MSKFPYQFFPEYVVRTPLFSRTNFTQILNSDEISEIDLFKIFNDPIFLEAIYLATPELYEEAYKWLIKEKKSLLNNPKLKSSILKYYIRMSTRCTPFGLFSGVNLGKFNIGNVLNSSKKNKLRDTKLDMHLLVSLSKTLEENPNIRKHLLYFPNNSIYKVGKRIRYIEYEYKDGKREYVISSAEISEELLKIINLAQKGKTILQMSEILGSYEISINEAEEFIEELINNQVLVSEFEPNVSGWDYLDTVISILQKKGVKKELETLVIIKEKLKRLDSNIGNPISLYTEIEELIKSLTTDYEKKHLFQADLYFEEKHSLSSHWKLEIKRTLCLLNKITSKTSDTYLDVFKKAFYDRFETKEISLSYALDTEIGIGYRQNPSKGIHSYLDDIELPNREKKQNYNIQLNNFQRLLNEKVQNAIIDDQFIINISDEDLIGFDENWSDLPDTISVMAEIISEKNNEKLCLGNGCGSSAANLLGRFCSEKSQLKNFTKKISEKESELNADYILAEIIHLPESRIGNVIRRPTLRSYEIPYLAQSILPKTQQIAINDLYISLKNNKIILRSKELNKEVKPYLTNAHNFYNNSMPIYNFLCDLQSQNNRNAIYFSWGDLNKIYKFLPRVEYKNVILSKAQWNISSKDLLEIFSFTNDKLQLLKELKIWRIKRQIPQWIQLVKSDNILPLNLENYDLAKIFVQTVKSEKSIIIEEFLNNENDDFKREFIFALYKN